MKRKKIAFLTTIIALASILVFSTCSLGYEEAKDVTNALAPRIVTQPQNVGVDIDATATFTVEAEQAEGAAGTLKYQWYQFLTFRAYQEQAGIKIDGETNASYSPPTNKDGEFNYYVVVSNEDTTATGLKIASVKSEPVSVTVNDPKNAKYPVITSQPSVSGDNLTWSPRIVLPTLEVTAEVTPAHLSDEIRYQWYVSSTLSNTQGTPIKDATSPRLIPPILIQGQEDTEGFLINGAGTYYYFVVVTNFYFGAEGRRESSVASSPVLLTIGANPSAETPIIKKHPSNAIYFANDTVAPLTVEADDPEDGGTLSYQWYSNDTSSNTDGSVIVEATSASLSLSISTSTPAKKYYYAVVTNTNNFASTNKTATTASRVAEINVTTPANRNANATFTVLFGPTNQHQFVRGFGGMDVAWGNFPNYNHPSLHSPLNISDDYENMFNPDILGYNMLRIMILPTYTDINRTLDELIHNQIYTTMDRTRFYENVKTVNRYGGYVLASPWSPPAAWKTNNSINGGGDLRESDYVNFANYLRAFAQNMLNNGAPIYAISIQNEPNYTAGYDGCEWTGDQARNFFRTPGVGHFTDGVAGFGGGKIIPSVKTMNGESANTTTFNRPAMNNAQSKANIDLLARHNYGSRNDNGAGTGAVAADNWIYHPTAPREIWMTEHNLNSNSGTTYPNDHTWNYVWLFLNDVDMTIRINHEAAFIWWSSKRFYSMIGDGTYKSRDGEILPRGWALAHYSKFAKETYRVGVSYSGTTAGGETLSEYNRDTNTTGNMNGNHYADFTSTTVKVSAFMKLRGGEERFPVNWRNQTVPIADIEEITMVMYTPTQSTLTGAGGYDMGTVKLQLPTGFRISSATAMRSDASIFDSGGTERGEPRWETVEVTADRNAAFVNLPRSTILSVRFTQ